MDYALRRIPHVRAHRGFDVEFFRNVRNSHLYLSGIDETLRRGDVGGGHML